MNRRTFLQSLGAAMATASMGVKFTPASPSIDYRLFTTVDSVRYDLSSPFSIGSTVYATDASVLIAHPGAIADVDSDRCVPKLSGLDWHEFDTGGFRPLHLVRNPTEVLPCEACFGIGRTGNYRACNHEHIADNGVCYDCRDHGYCGGDVCSVCSGAVWVSDYMYKVNGLDFAPEMIARIKTLGDLDVKVLRKEDEWSIRKGHHGICLFRGANGVRGMLMGLQMN